MQTAVSSLRGVPRLAIFRLFVPRLSRASPMLPLPASSSTRIPTIRLTAPSSSRSRYSSLAQDSPPPSPEGNAEDDAKLPIGTRLKVLIKSYGLYAIGVYLAIGVVDFSISFAAINLLGAEQVGRVTSYVKGAVVNAVHSVGIGFSSDDSPDGAVNGRESTANAGAGSEGLYAMLVLAYTVHKTLFMPLRAGLTVTMTPKLVRWLRMKGWTGKGGATRAAGQLRQSIRRKEDRLD